MASRLIHEAVLFARCHWDIWTWLVKGKSYARRVAERDMTTLK